VRRVFFGRNFNGKEILERAFKGIFVFGECPFMSIFYFKYKNIEKKVKRINALSSSVVLLDRARMLDVIDNI